MLWGDLLFRRLRYELNYLVCNIGKIGLSAFICCFGGILLWVDGTNIWHILRSGFGGTSDSSASVIAYFLLWLLTYGLCGAVLAILLQYGQSVGSSGPFIAFSAGCAMYLFQLVWYALFFCTSLVVFAFFILLTAFLLTCFLIFLARHGAWILKLMLILIALVELYFIYFNLTFYLS